MYLRGSGAQDKKQNQYDVRDTKVGFASWLYSDDKNVLKLRAEDKADADIIENILNGLPVKTDEDSTTTLTYEEARKNAGAYAKLIRLYEPDGPRSGAAWLWASTVLDLTKHKDKTHISTTIDS